MPKNFPGIALDDSFSMQGEDIIKHTKGKRHVFTF